MTDISNLTPASGLLRIETWKDRAYHRFYREVPNLAAFDPEATWQYRVETDLRGPIKSLACDIKITGRTVQWHLGERFIACRVTFPAYDGKPATSVPAKMFLPQSVAEELAYILAGNVTDPEVIAAAAACYAASDFTPQSYR